MKYDDSDDFKDLYDDFVRKLSDGGCDSDTFYDLGELIDIFDYANECFDSYVCNEVLRLGARLYPDSDELKVRQGIALIQHIDTDREQFERFIRDNVDRESLMWNILRLYLCDTETNEDKDRRLDQISGANFVEDEEVVQFVNAVEYLGRADWLLDNIDRLRTKCQYAPTLLFDVAEIARRRSRYDLAIRLLEELTMAEPFSIDFWISLAKAYDDTDRIDDGTTAIDYARTLDPDNLQAKMYAYERSDEHQLEEPQQLIVRLEELLTGMPDNTIVMQLLSQKYSQCGRAGDAIAMQRMIWERQPDDAATIAELIRLDPSNAREYLTRYTDLMRDRVYDEGMDHDIAVLCRIIAGFAHSNPAIAIDLYKLFLELGYDNESTQQFYLHMYLSGHDSEAVDVFESLAQTKTYQLPYEVYPIITSMYLKLGRKAETLACCEHFNALACSYTPYSLQSWLAIRGVKNMLAELARVCESGESVSGDLLDLRPLL